MFQSSLYTAMVTFVGLTMKTCSNQSINTWKEQRLKQVEHLKRVMNVSIVVVVVVVETTKTCLQVYNALKNAL